MKARVLAVVLAVALASGCMVLATDREVVRTEKAKAAPRRTVGGPSSARLRVYVGATAAELLVNGEPYGNIVEEAAEFNLEPGRYEIVVVSPGYASFCTEITLTAGNRHLIIADLKALPGEEAEVKRLEATEAKPFGRSGEVHLAIPHEAVGARLYVDGELVSELSIALDSFRLRLREGRHEIICRKGGHEPFVLNLNVTDDNRHVFQVDLKQIDEPQ